MIAGIGGALPSLTWLYFALSQFPIYLSPQFLRPLVRRILKRTPDTYTAVKGPKTSPRDHEAY